MVASGKARNEAPALRICVQLWAQEHADDLPFTNVPFEVIKRGTESTQSYIDSLKVSRAIIFRLKICLVGCSRAGKTSFAKPLIHKHPQLRLISGAKVRYEVTFWDFAGQDLYQVAHALFFSPRTLFFVFIDLEAFAVAYLQASIMSHVPKQEAQLMGEFIERTVIRWVRLVLTQQPDAEFVFLATKEELLAENKVTEELFKHALEMKLAEVDATIYDMRNKTSGNESSEEIGTCTATDTPSSRTNLMLVGSSSPASVQATRIRVEELIVASERAFKMPDAYTQALQAIVNMRKTTQDVTTRINRGFARVDSLPQALKIEPTQCRLILQTLHDLGDVLWYEDLGVALFRSTVILDPLLLIDFIRQVINHKHTGQTLPHADLKALPFWVGLSDQTHI